MHNIYTRIIAELQKFFRQTGLSRAVIGVSGGIDSAVCLKLAVDALGHDHVTALLMPEKGVSTEENLMHAKTLCKFLKVDYHLIPINHFLTDFLTLPWQPNALAQINTKSRLRMVLLYNFANTHNSLVIGTSNKTELYLGYATKYGDGGVDIDIIGDLFKEEVYLLAEHLGLPDEFLKKVPTAELFHGQTDETELGMSYREIDPVLKMLESGLTKEEIIGKGLNPNTVHKIFRLIEQNRHKVEPPHIIKVK
ncbi:MAG: NAD+ synthase [Candidatus Gracilibacteria bacterium]